MTLRVVPYTPEHATAAAAFNRRMDAAANKSFRLGETAPSEHPGPRGVAFRHFLAVDDSGQVRGGYFLRMQPFWVRGEEHIVGHFAAPLSEGIIDERYASVGFLLIKHALNQHPLLFAMGMGGVRQPLPRMLAALGWSVREVPFFFRVFNGSRFLRNIGPLRRTSFMRFATNALAYTGIGGAGIRLAQRLRTRPTAGPQPNITPISNFGPWADTVWQLNRDGYSFSAVRDAEYLRFVYPSLEPPFRAVRVGEQGWITLLDCKAQNESYFGKLKVAALLDGMGSSQILPALIHAAVELAEQQGADLLFSNQAHCDWNRALRRAGFWQGPSNYLLASSKQLAQLLAPDDARRIHFNRGDGDGFVNLLG